MAPVEGVSLDALVKRDGPLPVDRACDYVRQAALGLAHAVSVRLVFDRRGELLEQRAQ